MQYIVNTNSTNNMMISKTYRKNFHKMHIIIFLAKCYLYIKIKHMFLNVYYDVYRVFHTVASKFYKFVKRFFISNTFDLIKNIGKN